MECTSYTFFEEVSMDLKSFPKYPARAAVSMWSANSCQCYFRSLLAERVPSRRRMWWSGGLRRFEPLVLKPRLKAAVGIQFFLFHSAIPSLSRGAPMTEIFNPIQSSFRLPYLLISDSLGLSALERHLTLSGCVTVDTSTPRCSRIFCRAER